MLPIQEVVIRLVVAAFLGSLVGFEESVYTGLPVFEPTCWYA